MLLVVIIPILPPKMGYLRSFMELRVIPYWCFPLHFAAKVCQKPSFVLDAETWTNADKIASKPG